VFGKALGAHGIISVGIEPIKAANWEETKRKYRLPDKYLLCVGRVEKAKVNDLITCFSNYKQQYKESSLKLVMVGGIFGKVPDAAEVIYTGFVSDEEKIAIIQHAFLVVNPVYITSAASGTFPNIPPTITSFNEDSLYCCL
jgi:glycosyltransferase involved in cell wall biosynthesis